MNDHLTQQQLIDYQFKLASDAGMEEARAHLDQCDACRRRLAELNRTFDALDLLRGEMKSSDALIARTVENAAKPRRAKAIFLLRMPWLGAAAAAIVVGVALFMVSNLGPQGEPKGILTAITSKLEEAPAQTAERSVTSDARRVGLVPLEPERAGLEPAPTDALAAAGRGAKAKGPVHSVPARAPVETQYLASPPNAATSALDTAQEPPPFAPASAIELVVLPRRENVQLTIYNGADLTLVRERRNLTLKQGWNWLQFMWANTLIDPTSLTLEPLEHKGRVQVQQLVFPPRLRELGRWLIHSEVSGQVPFELTYFTSGLSWRAFYMGTLSQDETTMHLEAYVRVNNSSGEDYEDAQTRLLVGRVHVLDQVNSLARRRYPYGCPSEPAAKVTIDGVRSFSDEEREMITAEIQPTLKKLPQRKDVVKEGLSEYFLYTIEGTETILDKWGKRLLSFEADGIPVKALYKYDEQRWGTQTIQYVSFANDEEHKLGGTPLPDGMVRIYGRADEQGHLSYVGGTEVKYIPVGEEVELNLGPARLVEVKPVLMEERTENHVFDHNGNVSGRDEVRTWKIELTNARTLPVDIEITRGFETAYWTLKLDGEGVSYEKHDMSHARFRLTVEPRSKRAFEYTVTTYHGVREQSLANEESNKKD
ncbi:MAG: DUF4139 domain-containing protein [Sedimentisphaerales bacterium]|nr:DUF4139 domain-containing protein [Sedimentisphaerales bacterium]